MGFKTTPEAEAKREIIIKEIMNFIDEKVKDLGGFDFDIVLSEVTDRIDDKLDGAFSFEFVEKPSDPEK